MEAISCEGTAVDGIGVVVTSFASILLTMTENSDGKFEEANAVEICPVISSGVTASILATTPLISTPSSANISKLTSRSCCRRRIPFKVFTALLVPPMLTILTMPTVTPSIAAAIASAKTSSKPEDEDEVKLGIERLKAPLATTVGTAAAVMVGVIVVVLVVGAVAAVVMIAVAVVAMVSVAELAVVVPVGLAVVVAVVTVVALGVMDCIEVAPKTASWEMLTPVFEPLASKQGHHRSYCFEP